MNQLLLGIVAFWVTSFYSLQFTDNNSATVSMNNYQHKKILLVNIATNSPRVGQLAELQQLQEQYADSLIVLAFPSNSFNNESRSDSAIKQFCASTYGITFTIAKKNPVSGTGVQSIFNWFTKQSENGIMDAPVRGDFQKFLIDKEGTLIGVFAPSVSPMDSIIQTAIIEN